VAPFWAGIACARLAVVVVTVAVVFLVLGIVVMWVITPRVMRGLVS
jgi:hypothetical protein